MLTKLLGGLTGSSSAGAWALAAGATAAFYLWPRAAPPVTPAEIAAFNARRKAETEDAAAARGGARR